MSFADDIRKSYSENKSPIKESEPIDKVAKKIMAHVKSEISSKVKDKHAVFTGSAFEGFKKYIRTSIYLSEGNNPFIFSDVEFYNDSSYSNSSYSMPIIYTANKAATNRLRGYLKPLCEKDGIKMDYDKNHHDLIFKLYL